MNSAVYGSRLDSRADNRVLCTLIRTFFDKKVLQGANPIPGTNTVLPQFASASTAPNDLQKLITSLPDADNPTLLCLAANVTRAEQETSGKQAVLGLRRLSVRQLSGVSTDCSAWQGQLQPFLAAWQALQRDYPALRRAQQLYRTGSLGEHVRAFFATPFVLGNLLYSHLCWHGNTKKFCSGS